MIDSPRAAREAVYDTLKDYTGAGVSKGDGALPRPVAVSVGTDGMTPDFFQVAVRVFVAVDAEQYGNAYDMLDDTMLAVDQLLASGPWGPSAWQIAGDDKPPMIVATCILDLGREDNGG